MSEEATAERVSWVELYFDLVFVFAAGQARRVAIGYGLSAAAWAVAIAAYVTRRFPGLLKDVTADPLSYFGSAPGDRERLPAEGG